MSEFPAIQALLGNTLVLVAHPDDETVGCGALLQRMREPHVAYGTDGAPAAQFFWEKYGSRERYREVRREEAKHALAHIGLHEVLFFRSGDQELYTHLPEALGWVIQMVQQLRPEALLAHAYEGGHPDHDCCAFLAAAAGKVCGIQVWEMPLYWRTESEIVRQQPLSRPGASEAFRVVPSKTELLQKRRMAASHRSQRHVLEEFDLHVEAVRPQPAYDFSQPPHAGRVNYEIWGWDIRASDLCAAFTAVQNNLSSYAGTSS